jgi:hypothetical protein
VLLRSLAPVGLECTLGHEKVPAPDSFNGLRANCEYKSLARLAPNLVGAGFCANL